MKSNLLGKDRGVSPVIGVVLMVAITVILAAVIGAFVLGFQNQASYRAPQATIGIDATVEENGEGNITLNHLSGEDLFNDEIRVLIRNLSNNTATTEWEPMSQDNAQALSTGGQTSIDYRVIGDDLDADYDEGLSGCDYIGTINGGCNAWSGDWNNYPLKPDKSGIEQLQENMRYRVMLIHDDSGRMVADQTVTPR